MRLLPLTLLLTCLLPATLYAQEGEADPALPDIAPQEVEIRGELEFDFPRLERQPLVGFNPPPRVPEVPEARRPWIEAYKQPAAALPGADSGPALDPLPESALAGEGDALLEAGGGAYLSRYLEGAALLPLSATERLSLRFAYEGRAGHTPDDALPEAESARNAGTAHLALSTRRAGLHAALATDAFLRSYVLYGLRGADPEGPVPVAPTREGRGATITARAGWETPGVTAGGAVHYAGTVYDTDVLAGGPFDHTRLSERRVGAEADVEIDAGTAAVHLDVQAATTGLDGNGASEGDNVYGHAGVAAAWPLGRRAALRVGARVLAVQASAFSGADEGATYLSPTLAVDLYPTAGLHVYVRHDPGLETGGVAALFDENPYLGIEPRGAGEALSTVQVQPAMRHVDLELGARRYGDRTRLSVFATWTEHANRAFFTPAAVELGPYDDGFFQARYGAARELAAGAEATLFLTGRVQAGATATVRRARLTGYDAAVPFRAPAEARATLSYALTGGRGLLRLGARLRAPAYVDLAEQRRNELYADVDAYARYRLAGGLSLVARLRNALPGMNEWWTGYPEPPVMAQIGLRLDR